MQYSRIGLAFVILASSLASALDEHSSSDPIEDNLDRAVGKFNAEIVAAREELEAAIESHLNRAERNNRLDIEKRLELVATLKKQQETFLDSAKPPTLRQFRSDVARYVRAITRTHQDCVEAHEKAAEDYGRLGNLTEAKKVLDELVRVRAMQLFGNDRFYPGQIYDGTRAHGQIRGEYFALEIIECDRGRFIAMASGPNDREYPVAGVAADGKITARMRGTMDKVDHNFSGTLENDEVRLNFSGINAGGGRIKGIIRLKLAESTSHRSRSIR